MALIDINFVSETLGMNMSATVILPQPELGSVSGRTERVLPSGFKYPVLWLLHGLSDDHTAWSRMTSIERYAVKAGIAVVMPSGHRSCYNDMQGGYPFQKFISRELPAVMRGFFPLSERREDNFIGGLSMGGYGAFRTALAHPELYAAVASLSGAVDIVKWFNEEKRSGKKEMMWQVFGDTISKVMRKKVDIFELADQLKSSRYRDMPLYQCCGTEDFLYNENVRFREHVKKLGLNLTYHEGPGTHEWAYWDEMIQKVIKWLPVKKRKIKWMGK